MSENNYSIVVMQALLLGSSPQCIDHQGEILSPDHSFHQSQDWRPRNVCLDY
jgi:hypothetical protein